MSEPPARPAAAPPPELWGGVECTINRVGGGYHRQLARSGHLDRPGDLDRFAELGVRALRYPVLWEQHAPAAPGGAVDWRWADARLGRLRALGVRPIVGLVHHGSGPAHTSLVDPAFPRLLAEYAGLVAERYPWVEDWTPVNEPLTTARFSALYGHWYPHARCPRAFARALVGQCRAVQLSMAAVRRVNPAARLVQTDDLGRVHATAPLAGEAAFQNERRWLAFDLLCGRVDRAHPLRAALEGWGADPSDLDALADAPCPPDVIGINHYLTSDRYLDHRVERYPGLPRGRAAGGRGGRGVEFVDVEAVRACAAAEIGVEPRLREAWARYGRPLAVTECHLGCTREEQLRWLHETWRGAEALRAEGADVRAVTVWSLLGAFDWNSLVTRDAGHYEPGPFDVRGCVPDAAGHEPAPGAAPRPTALAALSRQLARGDSADAVVAAHPVLAESGWWRRVDRLFYPAAAGRSYLTTPAPDGRTAGGAAADAAGAPRGRRLLLITGASGLVGSAVARLCDVRGIPHAVLGRDRLDVTDASAVEAAVAGLRPWAVVHAAGWGGGWARVDAAERDPAACRRATADAAAHVAAACARHGARLVTFSSDLVFDGGAGDMRRVGPYVESDPAAPLGAYGRALAAMEAAVLGAHPAALVARTGACFGPWDGGGAVGDALRALARGEPAAAASDVTVSPTYVVDLVHAALDLLVDGERGLWHLANRGQATWADFVRRAAQAAGVDDARLEARPLRALGAAAPRPRYSVLGSERARLLPALDDALARFGRHRALAERAAPGGRAGEARRRGYRPWRYQQAGGWV